MRPRLFTLISAMSLLLCAMTVALWVRSYSKSDAVSWYGQPSHDPLVRQAWQLTTGQGGIAFYVQTHRKGHIEPFPLGPDGFSFAIDPSDGRYAGAGLVDETTARFALIHFKPIPTSGVIVPAWSLTGAFGALPLLVLLRWLARRRRTRAGGCPACGYDLRATPHRCPECGAVPERKVK